MRYAYLQKYLTDGHVRFLNKKLLPMQYWNKSNAQKTKIRLCIKSTRYGLSYCNRTKFVMHLYLSRRDELDLWPWLLFADLEGNGGDPISPFLTPNTKRSWLLGDMFTVGSCLCYVYESYGTVHCLICAKISAGNWSRLLGITSAGIRTEYSSQLGYNTIIRECK